jgi:protoporphyrinogen IX oxidase
MLWLKSFHIVFVVTWFAGLFYLPRLFIYHLETSDAAGQERFVRMQRKLLVITHIGAALALLFGLALLGSWIHQGIRLSGMPWMHAKLFLVLLLLGYHHACMRIARRMAAGERPYSDRFLRWFNEVPALLLIAIVVLVVVKPWSA